MKKFSKKRLLNNKKIILFLIIVLVIFILISNGDNIEDKKVDTELEKYFQLRENMVEGQLKIRDISDKNVLDVMGNYSYLFS